MNKISIKSNHFFANISKTGAEILSVQNTVVNKSYFWDIDTKFWNRISPNLFPIVGRLKNDNFQFKGQSFQMFQHGFARNLEFELSTLTENSVSLILNSNEDTRKNYPFDFVLEISYFLIDNNLDVHYKITNCSEDNMPFSVGAHPAFALNHSLENYQLVFDQPFTANRHLIDGGIYTGQSEPVIDGVILDLSSELIQNDAIVFKKPPFYSVTLQHQSGQKLVTVSSSDFQYWGFWSKPGAPFFCIEPWAGLADSVDSNGNLFEKEGIQIIKPNQTVSFSYSIEFH